MSGKQKLKSLSSGIPDKITTRNNNKFMKRINRIETFNQVNYLHNQGVNLCKGCQFEHTASCGVERLKTCNLQYAKL